MHIFHEGNQRMCTVVHMKLVYNNELYVYEISSQLLTKKAFLFYPLAIVIKNNWQFDVQDAKNLIKI